MPINASPQSLGIPIGPAIDPRELPSTLGEKLSADFRPSRAISANLINAGQLRDANRGEYIPRTFNFETEEFEGGEFAGPSSAIIDKTAALEQARVNGVEVEDIPDTGIPQEALSLLIDRKREDAAVADIDARFKGGAGASALGLGAMFLGEIVDPLNVAAALIPVVGETRYAALLAKATKTGASRLAVRAKVGALEGFVGGAAIEPLNYLASRQLQDDYTLTDALTNIAFETVLGSTLQTIPGGIVDNFNARKAAKLRAQAGAPGYKRPLQEGDIPELMGMIRASTEGQTVLDPGAPLTRELPDIVDNSQFAAVVRAPDTKDAAGLNLKDLTQQSVADAVLRSGEIRAQDLEGLNLDTAMRLSRVQDAVAGARQPLPDRPLLTTPGEPLIRVDTPAARLAEASNDLTPGERLYRQELVSDLTPAPPDGNLQAVRVEPIARDMTAPAILDEAKAIFAKDPTQRTANDLLTLRTLDTPELRRAAEIEAKPGFLQTADERIFVKAIRGGEELEYVNTRLSDAFKAIDQIDKTLPRRTNKPETVERLTAKRAELVKEIGGITNRLAELGENPYKNELLFARASDATKGAALRAAISQDLRGSRVNVETIFRQDPAAGYAPSNEKLRAYLTQQRSVESKVTPQDTAISVAADERLKQPDPVESPQTLTKVVEDETQKMVDDLRLFGVDEDEIEATLAEINEIDAAQDEALSAIKAAATLCGLD